MNGAAPDHTPEPFKAAGLLSYILWVVLSFLVNVANMAYWLVGWLVERPGMDRIKRKVVEVWPRVWPWVVYVITILVAIVGVVLVLMVLIKIVFYITQASVPETPARRQVVATHAPDPAKKVDAAPAPAAPRARTAVAPPAKRQPEPKAAPQTSPRLPTARQALEVCVQYVCKQIKGVCPVDRAVDACAKNLQPGVDYQE